MRYYPRTSLPGTDVATIMHSRQYKLVAEYLKDGQFAVCLWQNKEGFAVTYGVQLADKLPYVHACQELGECLLHQLSCAGEIQEN